MPQVSVSINGKIYRMACDEGEEDRLMGLGERFDNYVETLKSNFGEIGDQRLTVMAAIMVVDELTETQRQIKGLEAEIASLRESRNAVVDRYEANSERLAQRLDEAAQRIARLAEQLASADPDAVMDGAIGD